MLTGFLDVLQDQVVPNATSSCNAIMVHNVNRCTWTLYWLLGSTESFSESGVLLKEHTKQMIVDN